MPLGLRRRKYFKTDWPSNFSLSPATCTNFSPHPVIIMAELKIIPKGKRFKSKSQENGGSLRVSKWAARFAFRFNI